MTKEQLQDILAAFPEGEKKAKVLAALEANGWNVTDELGALLEELTNEFMIQLDEELAKDEKMMAELSELKAQYEKDKKESMKLSEGALNEAKAKMDLFEKTVAEIEEEDKQDEEEEKIMQLRGKL